MKKQDFIIGALIIILAILCVVLWHQKEAERAKLESLCESRAAAALEEFTNYTETGEEFHYIRGVAEFRGFMTAYLFLHDNVGTPEYTFCSNLYGEMTLSPEKVQKKLHGIIEALEYLSKDYNDPYGFMQIHAHLQLDNVIR